jgi:hypothetical protein
MDINPQQILEVATQVIGVASIIASITPTPVDNVVLVTLRKLIDLGAFNFLHAKNKEK